MASSPRVIPMTKLRERGIYRTPSGDRLVASKLRKQTADGQHIFSRLGDDLSCFLFSAYQWAFHGFPDYEVAVEGDLIAIKETSALQLDDLIDTGATAGTH